MPEHYVNEIQTDWDKYLPMVAFAYRTAYQSSLRSPPFGMLYGREARLPSDVTWVDDEVPTYDPRDYRQQLDTALVRRRAWGRKYLEQTQSR